MKSFLILGICLLISDGAQVLLKYGLMKIGGFDITGSNVQDQAVKVFCSPFIWAGFLLWGAGSVLWLTVLTHFRFSSAMLYSSVHYINLLLIAAFIFKEHISIVRCIGAVFIVTGVMLVSKT